MTATERKAIAATIAEAEAGTTGRILVRVIPDRDVEPFERAKREFEGAALQRHAPRNAALILVAPNARRFAVLGDRALHERVGEAFWRSIVERAQPHFASGAVDKGIVHLVASLGSALREHFPAPGRSMPS